MFKLLLLLVGIGLAVTNGSHRFFYRRDYTYIAEFDAFYKFHWDPNVRSWTDAFKACDNEGAKLFYPKEDLEWTVVNNLTDVNLMNTSEVILGFRDPYGFGEFVNVDGQQVNLGETLLPTSVNDRDESQPRCIYMEITTGLYNTKDCFSPESIPFVCKKVDESPCPTIDLEYVYNKEVRKCYKVNKRQRTWQEAYHTCFLEGAMLVVMENESEAKQIRSIIEYPKTYHVGFSKIDTDYFTVTGKRLEKAYTQWIGSEPTPFNNYDATDLAPNNLECGAVGFYQGLLITKTVSCLEVLSFVCEMATNVVG